MEQAKFNRNAIVETILEEIEDGAEYIIYQGVRRPYAHVAVNIDGFKGLGFSKICGNDKWNERYGLNMATKRAVRHAVDNMKTYLDVRGES